VLHACEALSFSKTDINKLENLINRALCQTFNVYIRDNILFIRDQIRERMIIRSVSYRNGHWVYRIESASVVSGKTRYYVHHSRFGSC